MKSYFICHKFFFYYQDLNQINFPKTQVEKIIKYNCVYLFHILSYLFNRLVQTTMGLTEIKILYNLTSQIRNILFIFSVYRGAIRHSEIGVIECDSESCESYAEVVEWIMLRRNTASPLLQVSRRVFGTSAKRIMG